MPSAAQAPCSWMASPSIRPAAGEPASDLLLEEEPRRRVEAAGGRGPAADDRDRLDLEAGFLDRLEIAADLAEAAQLLQHLLALVEAEGAVVLERRRQRIEVVGFLADVQESDAHGCDPLE